MKESFTTTHFFLVEDGDFWTFSSLPQLLMDRVRSEDKVQLSQWLKDEQRQDISHSLGYLSLSIAGTPKFSYQLYLSTMLYLADLSDAPLIFTLCHQQETLIYQNRGVTGRKLTIHRGNYP